ncbi:hypothetical protein [Sphingobacterium paludis]|uniref:Uncharacterized protein n=1 Tax=Sphingobacterium paludis TaxID=1476465 RepID=A0A4R7CZC9_9SPHI|nr:hypothetical protein [Sphingobacterium paludis]TDS11896.1 hypothetical protein B0I21_107248 [Sphingobacterium paludis]
MGLFLQPLSSFACEEENPHAPMSCCDKDQEVDRKSEQGCCTNQPENSEADKHKCASDASCHCPIVKTPIYFVSIAQVENQHEFGMHHSYPRVHTASPKSGFAATWLLPKIA